MKFRSDNHRKAVFANMFSRKGKNTRVNTMSVVNTEVKLMKSSQVKLPKIKGTKMRSQNVKLKDVKASREFCRMCKRGDKKLTKGRCRTCVKENNKFIGKGTKQHSRRVWTIKFIERRADRNSRVLRDISDLLYHLGHDRERVLKNFEKFVEDAKDQVRRGNIEGAKRLLVKANDSLWIDLFNETRMQPEDFWGWNEWEAELSDLEASKVESETRRRNVE